MLYPIGAAILSNLLRLSMLRKPDGTSVVSQTVFVDEFVHIINCGKLCIGNSISVAYANMPYCIAKYCHVSYESTPSNAHFHRLPNDALYVGNG